MKNISVWITRTAIGILLLSFAAILLIGWINPTMGDASLLAFVFLYCCGGIPLWFVSSTWLIVVKRAYLSKTIIWLCFQVLFIVAMVGSQLTIPTIALLAATLFLILFPLLGVVDFLYACQHNLSLQFMAIGSIVFVWATLLAWRIQGNLVEYWLTSLGSSSGGLWWLSGLMALTGWMILSGLVCFLVETFQVLVREFSS